MLYKHNEGNYKIIELSNFEDNYKKFKALGQTDSINKEINKTSTVTLAKIISTFMQVLILLQY